jgi:acetyl-CoA synthetase
MPNLFNYEQVYREFSWSSLESQLQGTIPKPALNMADLAVDRHVQGKLAHKVALRFITQNWTVKDFTYLQLSQDSNRFANILNGLGIAKDDRVFGLTGRIPALYIAVLGSLKSSCVFCPLFWAFGPEPIRQRLERGDAKVLVTTETIYRQKVLPLLDYLPKLEHILLTDSPEHLQQGFIWSLEKLMSQASVEFNIIHTQPNDMALLHFTSGTTGLPKGAIHVHQAIYQHYMSAKYALDLHQDDIFWCSADPGWVTGTSYGILAPLTHGVTSIIDEAEFDAERWYRILESQKVTVWYTAPTAIRRLMRMSIEPREKYDLSHLRLILSVGEPLNPEAIFWGQEKLGLAIYDNWWQTETGSIMIANYPSLDIRPGSMGKPLPGIKAAIVKKISGNEVEVINQPDVEGELALKPGWPSMFRGYLHEPERYSKCFVGDWYISGDLAKCDKDGYYWFVGREDDIIKTSGHMVGPFEVESSLMEHPAVAEAAVIGIPNPVVGEIVKAFVCLKSGYSPSEKLKLEIIGFARGKLGAAIAPKELQFQENLPKTRSGKIMRRLLRAREMGLPEGDLSSLESD